MNRPSDKELCNAFRELLTRGFYTVNDDGEINVSETGLALALQATKPWRNEIWKMFREIEDRMFPLEALDRRKEYERRIRESKPER